VDIFTHTEILGTDPDFATPASLDALAEYLKSDHAWSISHHGSHLEFGEIYLPKQRMYVAGGKIDLVGPYLVRVEVTTSWLQLAQPYFVSLVALIPAMLSKSPIWVFAFLLLGPLPYFWGCRVYAIRWVRARVLGAIASVHASSLGIVSAGGGVAV
jgi:hypothetical protein